MNRYLKTLTLMLAILLLGSLSAAAAERPLSISGAGTLTNDGAIIASGRATHLGLFTETGQLSFVPDPDNSHLILVTGEATFTAANGDELEGVMESAVLDVTTGIGNGVFVFTGGTGRFEGATGTVDFVVEQNLVTGAFEINGVGTLNY